MGYLDIFGDRFPPQQRKIKKKRTTVLQRIEFIYMYVSTIDVFISIEIM